MIPYVLFILLFFEHLLIFFIVSYILKCALNQIAIWFMEACFKECGLIDDFWWCNLECLHKLWNLFGRVGLFYPSAFFVIVFVVIVGVLVELVFCFVALLKFVLLFDFEFGVVGCFCCFSVMVCIVVFLSRKFAFLWLFCLLVIGL